MNIWSLSHTTLAFFALAMSIVSLLIKRSPWIWGSFLTLSFALAYMAKIITPIALAPIGGLLVLHTLLKGDIRGPARFILVLLTTAISLGLVLHTFPGFHTPLALQKMGLNFDAPFLGYFVLAVGFPLLNNLKEFKEMMKKAIPLMIGGIVLLILIALYTKLVQWDPKLPQNFWFFLIQNLLFTCVIEEAFWRGFIQREFFRWLEGRGYLAHATCILATALFFAALQYFWLSSLPASFLAFVAAVVYGTIFQYTKSLEASICCHWLFNITLSSLFLYN